MLARCTVDGNVSFLWTLAQLSSRIRRNRIFHFPDFFKNKTRLLKSTRNGPKGESHFGQKKRAGGTLTRTFFSHPY